MAFVTKDNLTDLAVKRWATTQSPRLAEVMTALVRHLHAFARDVDLTGEEWAAAVECSRLRAGSATTSARSSSSLPTCSD